jgi:hypothetical protein
MSADVLEGDMPLLYGPKSNPIKQASTLRLNIDKHLSEYTQTVRRNIIFSLCKLQFSAIVGDLHRSLRHELALSRSKPGIVGSNPTQGMDVSVRLFCVCVDPHVGSDLATG